MIAGVLSSRFLRLGLLCVGLALAAQWLAQGWAINSWSLKELRARMGTGPLTGEAPAGHRRAALWLAQEALAAGDAVSALVLLEPRVQQGDRLAVSVNGHALAMQGEREAAVQAWEKIGDFNSLQAAAEAWAAEGLTSDADLAFQAAYRIKPELIANGYADFLRDTRGLDAAESFLSEVLKQFPNSAAAPQWYHKLGEYFRQEGSLADAEEVFLEGLEKAPGTELLLTGLGWIYYEQGRRNEAIKCFENAVQLKRSQGFGQLAMGQLLVLEGRYEEAYTWLGQATAMQPTNRSWCLARGNVAREGGLNLMAIQAYHECDERFPQDVEIKSTLAWAYYQEKQFPQALKLINEAMALSTEPNVTGWTRAALIYEANGMVETALEALQKVIDLDPGNEIARQGIDRLRSP